ncbi:MAG TPA: hypothetical protein DF383_02530, partial [Deltaproteobacteria bacterium]|nr:hypothetical protein [Deltaproteobacteria bacterium]
NALIKLMEIWQNPVFFSGPPFNDPAIPVPLSSEKISFNQLLYEAVMNIDVLGYTAVESAKNPDLHSTINDLIRIRARNTR